MDWKFLIQLSFASFFAPQWSNHTWSANSSKFPTKKRKTSINNINNYNNAMLSKYLNSLISFSLATNFDDALNNAARTERITWSTFFSPHFTQIIRSGFDITSSHKLRKIILRLSVAGRCSRWGKKMRQGEILCKAFALNLLRVFSPAKCREHWSAAGKANVQLLMNCQRRAASSNSIIAKLRKKSLNVHYARLEQ